MFLALNEIRKEKARFLTIIGIIVLISYLVFFLTGLAYGLAKDNTSAVEFWDAQQVVLNKDSNGNIASSMMEATVLSEFEGSQYSPINLGRSVARLQKDSNQENKFDIVLIGLEQDSTAYPELIEGEIPSSVDEVVVSISLQEENNANIGDKLVLSMNDRVYTITGFTPEAKFNVSPVIYTDLYEASAPNMSFRELADVDATSGATTTIPERISGIIVHDDSEVSTENYDVLPIGSFINELPGYIAQVLTFGLMIGFLILISSIVLGVFLYIITIQKKQTFGIMKVQGISNRVISNSVVVQTIIVSVVGILIGLGLTLLSEWLLPSSVPFKSQTLFYLVIGLLILFFSLLGAIFSVRGVTKVDPLEVLE